jgi:hypothetical protein
VPRARTESALAYQNALSSVNYLASVHPDAVVCCINPEDSEELIRRMLAAIEMVSTAKCIAYAMTPNIREFREAPGGESTND